MAERGGGVYARMDARPHTRKANRVPRKSYAKGVPRPKIHQFEGGNVKGSFEMMYSLVAESPVQIKHNALEAARVTATKTLSPLGINNYFLKIRVYPHHILRENPLATGAGADRFQEGMSRAYGKPIGMAARIRRGQKIISVSVRKEKEDLAKNALRKAKMKFPVKCRIVAEEKPVK